MTNRYLFLVALLFSLPLPAGAQTQIAWKSNFKGALAVAKQENKPLLICVNMDNDVANDRMVKEHYRDAKIVAKTSEFVCLFMSKFRHKETEEGQCQRCGHISCNDHMKIERDVRKALFETNDVVAPQHIFLTPDGKLLKSKLYFLTKDELLSLLDSVLRELFPDRFVEKKEEEKAKTEKVDKSEEEKSKDEEGEEEKKPETIADFKELILASEDKMEIKGLARTLIKRKDEKEAGETVAALLASQEATKAQVCGILLAYGFKGNKAGVAQVLPFLTHKEGVFRSHAAVALEDIGVGESLKPLLTQLKREKEDGVRKNLARAIGASLKKKSKSQKTLEKLLRDKSKLVQRNAAIALGHCKRGGKAEKLLLTMAFTRRGGGRRGGGGGIKSNQAALYALVQMDSKKAKEKTAKQIERSPDFIAAAYEKVMEAFEAGFHPANPEMVRWRRTASGDKIPRDLDPPKQPGQKGKTKGQGKDKSD